MAYRARASLNASALSARAVTAHHPTERHRSTTDVYTGSATYIAVITATAAALLPLKSLTFLRIAVATDSSSISCKPVPSTSQTPACAMFHNPVFALPTNPSAKTGL